MNFIPFILASGSPRRKQLLNQIGLEFTVIPSDVDEDFTLDLPPEAFTEHWAREKAKSVAKIHPDSLIVGADTIVVLDGNILGKPKDKKDSFNMLQSLSGKTHEVITGVSFISLEQELDHTFNERTFVSFNTLSDRDINSYIDIYNPLDKAGSYGIQDWFSVHIHRVEGCYYNVMGLPLSSFYSYFKSVSAFLINHDHHH
jgi:septum formation protein